MLTTEQFFAGERLAFNMYVAALWNNEGLTWHVILSRVMEKSSAFAVQCGKRCFQHHDWNACNLLEMFSDGPKQFKSSEYLASMTHDTMLEYHLTETTMNWGCPKHWKGPWDRTIARMKTVWRTACDGQSFLEISEVVDFLRKWALQEEARHPGSKWIIEEFMPPDKTKIKRSWFDLGCLGGLEASFAYTFRCNDKRAWTYGHFHRCRGHDLDTCIYLDGKNTGLSGLGGTYNRNFFPVLRTNGEDEAVAPEEVAALDHCTKIHNNWRCSYVDNKANAATRRKQHLEWLANYQPPGVANMEEVHKLKTFNELADAYQKKMTDRMKRLKEEKAATKPG